MKKFLSFFTVTSIDRRRFTMLWEFCTWKNEEINDISESGHAVLLQYIQLIERLIRFGDILTIFFLFFKFKSVSDIYTQLLLLLFLQARTKSTDRSGVPHILQSVSRLS